MKKEDMWKNLDYEETWNEDAEHNTDEYHYNQDRL
jgi:hypothetical protein